MRFVVQSRVPTYPRRLPTEVALRKASFGLLVRAVGLLSCIGDVHSFSTTQPSTAWLGSARVTPLHTTATCLRWNRSIGTAARSRSTLRLATTSSPGTATSRISSSNESFNRNQNGRVVPSRGDGDSMTETMEYYDPNQIHPHTMSLSQSIRFFANYLIQSISNNRRKQRLLKFRKIALRAAHGQRNIFRTGAASRQKLRKSFKALNEQRRNLVSLADYSAKIVVPSFATLLAGALLNSVVPHYYARCMQLVAVLDGNTSAVLHALLGLTVTSLLAALLTGFRGSLFWIAGTRANYNIRVKLHRCVLLQEAAFFDATETGILLSRLNNDVNKIGMVVSFHVNIVLRQLAQFLFGSIYLIRISPILSFWTFCGIGLVGWLSAIYGDFNRRLSQQVQDTFAHGTAIAETAFSMSETVRAFNGVKTESQKYEAAQSRALQLEEVQAWAYGSHKFVSDALQTALHVALLLACWRLGRAGGLPAAKLTSFLFYTTFVLESSNEVGDQWAKIQGAVGASASVFDLIRRIPAVRDPPPPRSSTATSRVLPSRTNDTISHAPITRMLLPSGTDNELSNSAALAMNATIAPHLDTTLIKASTEWNGSSDTNGFVNDSKMPDVNGCIAEYGMNGEYHATNASRESTIAFKTNDNKEQIQDILHVTNVTLQYDSMEVPALNQVNLNVKRGDRVAIVGRSGSGKSSLLRCMMRFYDPTDGAITLTGTDLRDLSRRQMSEKVAMVQQEPALFPMSLLDNVLYGIDHDTVDPVTGKSCYSEVLRQDVAQCLEWVGLPTGSGSPLNLELELRVGEGGRALSGGQRQRVAVARALIRRPAVLVLDEPTAALDSASEQQVLTALQQAMHVADCMIMVTHRLNVIRGLNVNRVVVMEQGRIVEMGHPEELMCDEDGVYYTLAREQGIINLSCGITDNAQPPSHNQQMQEQSPGSNEMLRDSWNASATA